MVESIGDLILIFSLKLSIGSPYYQGGRIWTNFRFSKCFILRWYSWESRTSLTKYSAQSFCTGSDDPGLPQIIRPNSVCQYWVSPDDPALVRMIRGWGFVSAWKGQAGWSGPGKFKCVFSLFCYYPGWSEYICPFTPFIYFSLFLTNHASLAFISSLLSILELDSCKEIPRD